MWLPYRRSPRIAMTLVCGCALVGTYLFQRDTWRRCGAWYEDLPAHFAERYQPLRDLAPADEAMRFVVDARHMTNQVMQPDSRLYLAQHALSPRQVGLRVESRWVIVDSDSPEATPEIATKAGWRLAADLHNGVKLYRTDARK
jgi:hypothetical protein